MGEQPGMPAVMPIHANKSVHMIHQLQSRPEVVDTLEKTRTHGMQLPFYAGLDGN